MIPSWVIMAVFAVACFWAAGNAKGLVKYVLYLLAAILGYATLIGAFADWKFWLAVVAFVAWQVWQHRRKHAKKRREREERERQGGGTHYHTHYYNRP